MRQLKYSFILLYLVFANLYAQNFDIINQNNIEVNKLEMGYHIYIQKNSETAGLKLKYKLEDGSYSYLYANNSLININNLLKEKKKEELLNNWIRKQQKSTYVRISEGWRNCDFHFPGWVKE